MRSFALFLLFALTSLNVRSQNEIGYDFEFENLSLVQEYEVPGEGMMWGGFGPNTGNFYLYTKDYQHRATFITYFDPEVDDSDKFQIVKYMEDSSDKLYLAHSYFDDSQWNQIFRLTNNEGEILMQINDISSFFWGEVESGVGQLIIHREDSFLTNSSLYEQNDFDSPIAFDDAYYLHFVNTPHGLRYFHFSPSKKLFTLDANFNLISILDTDFGDWNLEWKQTSQRYFSEDDQYEFLLNMSRFSGGMQEKVMVMNQSGVILLERDEIQYRFDHKHGYNDKLVHYDDGLHWYSLPGLQEDVAPEGFQFDRRFPFTSEEYIYAYDDYNAVSDTLHSVLFRKTSGEWRYWRTISIALEEGALLGAITNVSATFFNDDPALEIIYTYRLQNNEGLWIRHQFVVNEAGDVILEDHGRLSDLYFGNCGEDNVLILNENDLPTPFRASAYSVSGLNDYQISDFAVGDRIRYFPNPTNGLIDLSWVASEESISNIQIYDALGRRVSDALFSFHCTSNVAYLDLSLLSAGSYIVKVFTQSSSESVKIVKY